MSGTRKILLWIAVTTAVTVPITVAAFSPLLAWRDPVYIVAGFAGIVAMSLLLIQPLLAGGYLPGLDLLKARRIHGWVGTLLVAAIVIHVIGLWITSPPDVIDALLFASPTPFSAWGVIAMWAVFSAALLAMLRHRLRLRPRYWRLGHTALVTLTVIASAIHAILIEGTMETMSKVALCTLVILATVKAVIDLRAWSNHPRNSNRTN